jgi:hypothetical protein
MPYLDDKEIETFKKIAEAVDNVINEYYLEVNTKNFVRVSLGHWICGEVEGNDGVFGKVMPEELVTNFITWFDEAYEFYHEEGLR